MAAQSTTHVEDRSLGSCSLCRKQRAKSVHAQHCNSCSLMSLMLVLCSVVLCLQIMSSASASAAAAAPSAAALDGEHSLLEASPDVLDALHVRVEELGNTHGGKAVRDAGVSFVQLHKMVMKLPGGKELAPLFEEHGKIYKKVVKAYISKTDELNDVSARLGAVFSVMGELVKDVKPCTCTATNCGNCACSKKKVPFCTDRCSCKANGNCARGQYQGGSGLAMLAEKRGDEAADAKAEYVHKAREKARQKGDAALQLALINKKMVKEEAKRAKASVAAAMKALALKEKEKKKRRVRTPPTSSSEDVSTSDSEDEEGRGGSLVNSSNSSSDSSSEDEREAKRRKGGKKEGRRRH
jgi:hypothetical protein